MLGGFSVPVKSVLPVPRIFMTGPRLAYIALAGCEAEDDGCGAEEDGRRRGPSRAQEVAEDPEAHAEHAGGDVRAPARERDEEHACCEKCSDGAGDPTSPQRRAPLRSALHVSLLAQDTLPRCVDVTERTLPGG